MQLLIDESFAEKVIPADDSVRLLDRIVEEMDLSKLERAYDVRGRKPATEPSIMFKILMYANMESIYSSRRIRTACQRDSIGKSLRREKFQKRFKMNTK